ncbi:hypothetical protein HYPSUDRAFT_132427 [Hypholoma sublateritium FD-334 SS-4]|uniref:Uncharacterized protein n=1 Tax=Hypholoma sublateritium (strain FD-334 SS-4) TaxID=945553 RepID=A0A0D2LGK8_HYPSF|nr:hypothetical protein HYPSUDRAFT_132427 [Hypholoma sublateritium FD-334 SS-4]
MCAAPPPYAPQDDYFAFARIADDVCLVQASSAPLSALTPVSVKIFRHEFISIFRLAEARVLHPADIRILEPIDARRTRYEEDSGTVFLARDAMARMRSLSRPQMLPRRSPAAARTRAHAQR